MGSLYLDMELIDGTADGKLRATLTGHEAIVYKASRGQLDEFQSFNKLRQPGIYFLFGFEKGQQCIYVGQAELKKDSSGKEIGVLSRVLEHRTAKEAYWTTVFMTVSSGNNIHATELNYLEQKFYERAAANGNYKLKNEQKPSKGEDTEKLAAVYQSYMEDVATILKLQGYDALSLKVAPKSTGLPEFYLVQKDASTHAVVVNAIGEYTGGGMTLKQGSLLRLTPKGACTPGIINQRKLNAGFIDSNGILQKDIQFKTPSGASAFAVYGSSDGWTDWKDKKGNTLKSKTGKTS